MESELARYDWIKGESLQSLFDRLMVLVNKIRVLGSEDWSDAKVTRLFMRAYKEKDKSLARMIRDRDDYEDMTPHQLFAKIQQHESEEAPIKSRDSHALITNVFLATRDRIIVVDPMGEYSPLIKRLGGQVIEIAPDSPHHINPMDIDLSFDEENPMALKADFILSLMELIVGGKDGLQPVELSLIHI